MPSGPRWRAADGRALSRVVKDMALTPADFRRGLAVAMGGRDYAVEGDRVSTGNEDRGVSITLRPLPARRLGGLLKLDHCEVTIDFTGYDEGERAAFLHTFERAYQRGGG